jgi:hypothetical protein
MAGRPSKYTEEIAQEILRRISSGESLRAICKSDHLPAEATIRDWIVQDRPPGISAQYAHARNLGLDCMADRMLEIAETPTIGEKRTTKADGSVEITTGDTVDRSRLAVDAIKWQLSKMAPKRYGDRIEIAGDKENPLEVNVQGVELLKARIDSLVARSRPPADPADAD